MNEYASWWLTAIALSSITLFYWLIIKRPLGVSGSWARVVLWKQETFISRADQPFHAHPNSIVDALMAATMEEFGDEAVQDALTQHKGEIPGLNNRTPDTQSISIPGRLPWTGHLLFLLMLPIGGFVTAMASGSLELQFNLGELHASYFGSGFSYAITLIVGGILIGFGTQLAGGCTTGHGLSGLSRLVPVSLIATCSFFAAAVAASLILSFSIG